jgi:hypothetical protein
MKNETPTVAEALAILRAALAAQSPGFVLSSVTIRGEFRLAIDDTMPISLSAYVLTAGRQLSPTEKAILKTLADGGWKKGATIAEESGWGRSSSFQSILSNLVEAGILESSHTHGYRLIPARETGVANGE